MNPFENIKIQKMEIQSFRGSTGHMILDFGSKDSKGKMVPASMLIFGDCGTGKSTIADAIELSIS
jgi:DNA repair exonuclease SbcCD ATPase subunit